MGKPPLLSESIMLVAMSEEVQSAMELMKYNPPDSKVMVGTSLWQDILSHCEPQVCVCIN